MRNYFGHWFQFSGRETQTQMELWMKMSSFLSFRSCVKKQTTSSQNCWWSWTLTKINPSPSHKWWGWWRTTQRQILFSVGSSKKNSSLPNRMKSNNEKEMLFYIIYIILLSAKHRLAASTPQSSPSVLIFFHLSSRFSKNPVCSWNLRPLKSFEELSFHHIYSIYYAHVHAALEDTPWSRFYTH